MSWVQPIVVWCFFYVFYSSTNFYSKRFKDVLNFTSRVCSFHTVLSNSSLGKEKESKNGFVFYFSEKKKRAANGYRNSFRRRQRSGSLLPRQKHPPQFPSISNSPIVQSCLLLLVRINHAYFSFLNI